MTRLVIKLAKNRRGFYQYFYRLNYMLNKHVLKECEFYRVNYLTPSLTHREFPMPSDSESEESEPTDESGIESELMF